MIFGTFAIDDALGCILAHTLRLEQERTLRKGTSLGPVELEVLREAGVTEVIAARLHPGDLGEDAAAAAVGAVVIGTGVEGGPARTGRCNLHAKSRGVLRVDVARVEALNLVDPSITLATLPPWTPVARGQLVATVKIMPFGVPEPVVAAACAAAGPAVEVVPFVPRRVGIVASTGAPTRVLETTLSAQRHRVRAVGCAIRREVRVAHEAGAVTEALREQVAAGLDLVLFVGASAIVDVDDVLPAAIRECGGEVIRLGMPVDPGNLALVGRCGGTVVLGVPGCARTLQRTGFDALLERAVAGVLPAPDDIARMGVGGLLAEIGQRPQPREGRRGRARVGAVVLAAGQGSRMPGTDKLLVELDGRPLVARAVDPLLEAGVRPVVVVTPAASGPFAAALGDRDVVLAGNPDPKRGMASSLAVGLSALDPDVDGFFVMLGDLPFVGVADVRALVEAFDPDAAPICVPEHARRRGHPVLWAGRFRDELAALDGDVGGRAVLEAHAELVRVVAVDNPGICVDVDTPEALAAARARFEG